MKLDPNRPDLPCPWCKGKVQHVIGCPSSDFSSHVPDFFSPSWESHLKAHEVACSYGDSEYGLQLMHLLETPETVKAALRLLEL